MHSFDDIKLALGYARYTRVNVRPNLFQQINCHLFCKRASCSALGLPSLTISAYITCLQRQPKESHCSFLFSVGFEILEDMTEGGEGTPNVVLVCCGGGGLLSGISAALKLACTNSKCKVYGVEPYGGKNSCHSKIFKTMILMISSFISRCWFSSTDYVWKFWARESCFYGRENSCIGIIAAKSRWHTH